MLSVMLANHCYSWNMGFILLKNAEGNALEPWPQMISTNLVNRSHGLRQRRVVRGRSTSCVCWKEEEWVERLPRTPSKNPEQRKKQKKTPPHKNRVGERSRGLKFNKAEVWREEADEDTEGSWREEAKHLDQDPTLVKAGVVELRSESETLITLSLNKLP